MIFKMLLVVVGLFLGFKKRDSIVYISYFIMPFTEMGGLKGINISFFELYKYMCFLPMLALFAMDLLRKDKKTSKEFVYIGLAVASLYLYILTRYMISLHPSRNNFITIIAAGFIVFLYVLYNSNNIDMNKIQLVTMFIIAIEVYLSFNQALGRTTSEIFPFVYSNIAKNNYIKLSNFYRAIGSQGDPNHYSMLLGILTGSLINQLNKISAKVFFSIGLIGLLFCFSRMGVLIFLILITIYIAKHFKNSRKSYLTISLLFFSMPITLILIAVIIKSSQGQMLITSIIERFQENNIRSLMARGSRQWIILNYFNNILNMKNLILGLGLQNFEYEMFRITSLSIVAHNQYIQMLADIGILGYVPILIIISIVNKKGLKNKQTNPFWLSIVILLFSNMFLMTTYLLYIYLYLGLYIAFKLKEGVYEEACEI